MGCKVCVAGPTSRFEGLTLHRASAKLIISKFAKEERSFGVTWVRKDVMVQGWTTSKNFKWLAFQKVLHVNWIQETTCKQMGLPKAPPTSLLRAPLFQFAVILSPFLFVMLSVNKWISPLNKHWILILSSFCNKLQHESCGAKYLELDWEQSSCFSQILRASRSV